MKKALGYFFATILLMSNTACKINQTKNHERVGRWVVKMRHGDQMQIIKENYNSKGFGKGIWKYYLDGKLYKREHYSKKGICYVTNYHPNGKVASTGQTKLEVKPPMIHWFYSGDWFYFNENDQLIKVQKYENGDLIRETFIKDKTR